MEAGCFLTVAAWVKHLLDKWDHWPGGPLIVFPETLLSSGRHLQGLAVVGREEPSLETLPPCSLAALPTAAFCSLASQAAYALYTELGCTLPVFDGCCPPSAMPEVFPQPWREACLGADGSGLRFLHIPAGPDPSGATGPCLPHPALWVTSEQTSMWLVWGWENFTNIRT